MSGDTTTPPPLGALVTRVEKGRLVQLDRHDLIHREFRGQAAVAVDHVGRPALYIYQPLHGGR